jgi:CHASE2 domain-containing sensor protein
MGMVDGRPTAQRAVTAAGYVILFVLGAVEGLIGSFQYSQSPAPLIAIVLDVAILGTCLFCGWGMRTVGGGLIPAVGWILASFIMSMGNAQGSIIITNTAAGQWYLYGGALAAAVGAVTAFVFWSRTQPRPR